MILETGVILAIHTQESRDDRLVSPQVRVWNLFRSH